MKKFWVVTAGLMMMTAQVEAEPMPNADFEMNQTREEMERQRVQRQIEEDLRRSDENITDERESSPARRRRMESPAG